MKFDISNYMINRQISKKTQLKVYNYLEYINKKENESPEKGQKILNLISENLKNEVYKEFYGMIMTNSKLFHNKFSKEFIQNVSLHMEEKMYAPGEIVYHEGTQDNQCLYYVLKGKVEMFTHRADKKHFLGYLKEGDSMGHRCFIASQPQEWSVVTAEVTHLVYITQQKFLDCLKEYPADQLMNFQLNKIKEVFMLTKDEIIFGQNRYMNPCYSCGKQTHMAVDCPLIHYQKNKQLFINRHLYSVPEKDRRSFKRSYRDKKKSLKQIKRVRNALKVVRTALEYSYFQNTQISGSAIVLNDKEKDKQFYFKMSKFKFNEENNLVIDSKMSEEFTENEEDDYDDYCDDDEGSQGMVDHQNSIIIEQQGHEIAELQEEEDEQTEIMTPKTKKQSKIHKRKKTYKSFQSLNFLDGEEDNRVQSSHQNSLLQRTLTNQYRIRQKQQQLDQSFCQSLDFEKEIANSSFLNKMPSQIIDLNSFNDKSFSLKRSSTTKPNDILQTQKTETIVSQKNLSPPSNFDSRPKDLNKQDKFRMSLQPIMLYKNFEDVLKNRRLDESFSPYQISQDDKNLQKAVQETNNQLFDHLNNSINKINAQPSACGKKRNINTENLTPKMNPKASNFKQYSSNNNNNNNFGSTHNLNNLPLYNQQFYPTQQHFQHNLVLTSQSSQKQNPKTLINSPAFSMYKRDSLNLTPGFGILAAYATNNCNNPNKKQIQENTVQKVNIDSVNNIQAMNQEIIQKQPRSNSNTQLPYFDSHGMDMTAAALHNYNLQNLNQILQGINLNQLNMNNPQHNQIIQMIKKRDEEFFMPNFEFMKDYSIYYPQYNCNNILKKISKKQVPLLLKKKRITVQGNTKTSRIRRNSSLKFPGGLLTLQQQMISSQ